MSPPDGPSPPDSAVAVALGITSSSPDSVGSESESESDSVVEVLVVDDRVDELDVVVDVEISDRSGVVCAALDRLEL